MPKSVEKKIAARGGAARYRTIKVGKGDKYMRVAITRKEGPKGGRTVATSLKPKTPKSESIDSHEAAERVVEALLC